MASLYEEKPTNQPLSPTTFNGEGLCIRHRYPLEACGIHFDADADNSCPVPLYTWPIYASGQFVRHHRGGSAACLRFCVLLRLTRAALSAALTAIADKMENISTALKLAALTT